jgi:RNA polymerase sigma-70 factor (ECF subfamily)
MTAVALVRPGAGPARRLLVALAAELAGAGAEPEVPGAAWPAPLHASPAARAAFTAFYRAERTRVVAVVASLTGDRAAAEDIAQEAFATALRKWSTVSRYERPGDWVRRVAVNRAISRFRRRTTEDRALRRVAGERDPHRRTPDEEDPLWVAVRALPRRQAQVISLMFIDDLTIERTADTLGISVGATKSHLHRAKTALAGVLRAEGADGAEAVGS